MMTVLDGVVFLGLLISIERERRMRTLMGMLLIVAVFNVVRFIL